MRSAVKNEQIEPWAIMGKYDSGKQHEWFIPPFFAHYGKQNGPISPQNGQNGQYPPKKGQKPGGWGICSLYSYINFGHFFVICPSPQNGGIVKESKVSHALDQVRFCIYFALDFVDEAAIMEQYGNEVGLAALEWCDVFDPEYRRSSWIAEEEWFTDMTNLIVDKWTSPCPW